MRYMNKDDKQDTMILVRVKSSVKTGLKKEAKNRNKSLSLLIKEALAYYITNVKVTTIQSK